MAVAADDVRALADRRGAIRNRDVVEALGVSAATAHRLLQAVVLSGVLERHGKGRAAHYRLRRLRYRFRRRGLDENQTWQRIAAGIGRVRPLDADEMRSLQYATTEILNNAVDHSGGRPVEGSMAFAGRGGPGRRGSAAGSAASGGIGEDFGFASPHA